MIGTIDIEVNAGHPDLALDQVCGFVDSPSSVRIANVPNKIGEWRITAVKVVVTSPDNQVQTVNCVHTNDVWVGTVEAPLRTGKTVGGFQVIADGVDENGTAVTGYVLGVGDYMVLNRDNTEGDTAYLLHLHDETPENPRKADIRKSDNRWQIYNDDDWQLFGGLDYKAGSGLALSGDTFSISAVIPTKTSQLENDSGYINELSVPVTTRMYSVSSDVDCPESTSRYYEGNGKVWKYQFDDEWLLSGRWVYMKSKNNPPRWWRNFSASYLCCDVERGIWEYRPDSNYEPIVQISGSLSDEVLEFPIKNRVDRFVHTKQNSKWQQLGTVVDTSQTSIGSIIDYNTLAVTATGKLQVNNESVPVLTTLTIYSEDSYFPYSENYCYGGMSFRFLFIDGYGSATKLTKFTDWCSDGMVEYTNETGLETGRFYWVYEFEKSTKDYAGYIIFKAQNPTTLKWENVRFEGTLPFQPEY